MSGGLTLTFGIMTDTRLAKACVDLCLVARENNVVCRAEFNGLLLLAGPDDDPISLVQSVFDSIAAGQNAACAPHRLSERLLAEAEAKVEICASMAKPAVGTA